MRVCVCFSLHSLDIFFIVLTSIYLKVQRWLMDRLQTIDKQICCFIRMTPLWRTRPLSKNYVRAAGRWKDFPRRNKSLVATIAVIFARLPIDRISSVISLSLEEIIISRFSATVRHVIRKVTKRTNRMTFPEESTRMQNCDVLRRKKSRLSSLFLFFFQQTRPSLLSR